MFKPKPGTVVNGVWFVPHNPDLGNCDWLAMVWTHPGEPTRVAFRFRYHREHLGEPDEKCYYGPGERALAEAIQTSETAAWLLSREWGTSRSTGCERRTPTG